MKTVPLPRFLSLTLPINPNHFVDRFFKVLFDFNTFKLNYLKFVCRFGSPEISSHGDGFLIWKIPSPSPPPDFWVRSIQGHWISVFSILCILTPLDGWIVFFTRTSLRSSWAFLCSFGWFYCMYRRWSLPPGGGGVNSPLIIFQRAKHLRVVGPIPPNQVK